MRFPWQAITNSESTARLCAFADVSLGSVGDSTSQARGGAKHAVTRSGIPPGRLSSDEDWVRPSDLIEGLRW